MTNSKNFDHFNQLTEGGKRTIIKKATKQLQETPETKSPWQECSRCGGTGNLPCYSFIEGGVCFKCGGSGNGKKTSLVITSCSEQFSTLIEQTAQERLETAKAKKDAKQKIKEDAKQNKWNEFLKTNPAVKAVHELQNKLDTGIATQDDMNFLTNLPSFVCDMVRQSSFKAFLSEKQLFWVHKCYNETLEKLTKRKEDEENAIDAPEGKMQVTGQIVFMQTYDNEWGCTTKMLIQENGFVVWASLPASIYEAEKGDTVTFTATLTRNANKHNTANAKRPSKASILEKA